MTTEIGLYEAMSSTRAVRRLRPDPVPDELVKKLVQAASWAATGGNVQPWRVVVVRDRQKMAALGDLYRVAWRGYTEPLRGAIAALPDEQRGKQERTIGAGDQLAARFAELPVLFVFCFDPNRMAITDEKQDRPSVVGGGSVYPAVQNLLLAARAEGLGCVLTTLLCQHEPEVRSLLAIPDPWYTCAAVPVGYPERAGHGPLSRRPPELLAFADRFGEPCFT